MKNTINYRLKNYVLILVCLSLAACGGLNTKSESSCKSTLVKHNFCIMDEGESQPGRGAWTFNDDGTFIFRKVFNNDGIEEYKGTWKIGELVEVSPKLNHRLIELDFQTSGEYSIGQMHCTMELREGQGQNRNNITNSHNMSLMYFQYDKD